MSKDRTFNRREDHARSNGPRVFSLYEVRDVFVRAFIAKGSVQKSIRSRTQEKMDWDLHYRPACLGIAPRV